MDPMKCLNNPQEGKKREIEDKQKTYNKMLDLSSNMSTITSKVDGLNMPIKRPRLPDISHTHPYTPTFAVCKKLNSNVTLV